MAELTDPTPSSEAGPSSCCSPASQETCCAPSEKPACCETSAAGGTCGCAADADTLREAVRERYAAAARATTDPTEVVGCCTSGAGLITDEQTALFGAGLYGDEQDALPDAALLASLGCGNPTAMVDLNPGDVVLDLGSGGGTDVLLSA